MVSKESYFCWWQQHWHVTCSQMCTIRFDLRVGRPRLDLVALSTPTYGPIADSNWEYQDIYWKLYISTSGDWDSLTKTNTLNIHRKWRLGSALQKFTCSSPDLVWSGLPSCRQVGGVLGRQGAAKTNILQNDVGITWHEESAPRVWSKISKILKSYGLEPQQGKYHKWS